MKFSFKTTDHTQRYCESIVKSILRNSGLTREEAVELVNAIWGNITEFDDQNILLNDIPYYYAMGMLHHPKFGDGRADWMNDPSLWPPPVVERIDRLY